MEGAEPGHIYHLSTPILTSIKDLVKNICNTMGKDFTDQTEIVERRLGLDDAYILDSTKAEKEFNWKPNISVEEGLKEVIKWVDDNWDIISSEPLEYIHKE